MADSIAPSGLHGERDLFLPGVRAGEFTFVVQDARGPDGTIPGVGEWGSGRAGEWETGGRGDAAIEARRTLDHLRIALQEVGQDLSDLVSLLVLVTDYHAVGDVIRVIDEYFPEPDRRYPATGFVGVPALDGGCTLRMDAVASDSPDRSQITLAYLPLTRGSRCHAVRVGDLYFLSAVDGGAGVGNGSDLAGEVARQTTAGLDRIAAVVESQGLSLADVVRTVNYLCGMSDRDVQAAFRSSRRDILQRFLGPEELPANTRVGVEALGENVYVRTVAIATRDRGKTYPSSDRVRSTPGLFAQSVRVGSWLFPAGQDAIGLDHQTLAIGNLAEQTEISLMHVNDVVRAAGGTLKDVAKTTVYLLEGQDRARCAAAYRRFFEQHTGGGWLPAGLTMRVRDLAPDCLVEIDAVAYLGPGRDGSARGH